MANRNMSLEKVKMPEQDPNVRNKNFDEVALGYTPEMAMEEARRCLHCKHRPCVGGCPVNVPIPEFIEKVAEGDFDAAYEVITRENALPAICGRVCPQEDQCEGRCVRGLKGEPVGIGRMERFVADYHMSKGCITTPEIEKNGIKVAVIGCGPSGITCAGELARRGYDVTVFEALHKPGGVLSYGIPEFRLPKALVAKEIENVERLGVKIETNVIVGKSITVDELMSDGYRAVFIGSGAGLPKFLNIPGESLLGVYSANEFLTRVNLMKAFKFPEAPTPVKVGKKVAVVNAQGKVFMPPIACPFLAMDEIIPEIRKETNIIIVDFHAEATSEKQAMGWNLTGKVSAVYGTHTHTQTADEKILPGGTAYLTDAGMTGGHDGILGMNKKESIQRFKDGMPSRYSVCEENLRINGLEVEVNENTGKAEKIKRINMHYDEV